MKLLCALLSALPAAALGQTVTFTFDNPQLQPAHYVMIIPEQGPAHFVSTPGAAPVPGALQPEPQDRGLTIPDPQRAALFSLARKHKLFAEECDNKHGRLAFTGTKTLAYAGPDGAGSCSFNYAKDQKLAQAADDLIAVANALEEGRKLRVLLEHDKLGLNGEIDVLAEEKSAGRALALQNIAPVLQAIIDDPDVLNHTRTSAQALLKP